MHHSISHEEDGFARINTFMVSIGATKHKTNTVPWPTHLSDGHATITHWHAPGYSPAKAAPLRPLLSVAGDPRNLSGPLFISSHWAIQNEYNPLLGIINREQTFANDLPWLIDFTDKVTALGYPKPAIAVLLSLLHIETEYGYPATQYHRDSREEPYTPRRPHAMLLDNLHAAGALATAKDLTPKVQRRYMQRAIPAVDLQNLLAHNVPYAYIKSIYTKRTPYEEVVH